MKSFLLGVLAVLVALAAVAAYVWHYEPERLPAEWRRENPRSRDYAPAVYRWTDDRGVVQLTDTPPRGRPYETVRLRHDQNVVPTTNPTVPGN